MVRWVAKAQGGAAGGVRCLGLKKGGGGLEWWGVGVKGCLVNEA